MIAHACGRLRVTLAGASGVRKLTREFVRYFVAGLLALACDYGVYVSLVSLAGWHYSHAAAMGFTVGLLVIYVLSISWIFSERRLRKAAHEFLIFVAIGVFGLALTELILYLLTGLLGVDYRVSKLVAAGSVFMFNFGFRKFFLFSAERR